MPAGGRQPRKALGMTQSRVLSATVGLWVALQLGEWGLRKGGDSRLTEGE